MHSAQCIADSIYVTVVFFAIRAFHWCIVAIILSRVCLTRENGSIESVCVRVCAFVYTSDSNWHIDFLLLWTYVYVYGWLMFSVYFQSFVKYLIAFPKLYGFPFCSFVPRQMDWMWQQQQQQQHYQPMENQCVFHLNHEHYNQMLYYTRNELSEDNDTPDLYFSLRLNRFQRQIGPRTGCLHFSMNSHIFRTHTPNHIQTYYTPINATPHAINMCVCVLCTQHTHECRPPIKQINKQTNEIKSKQTIRRVIHRWHFFVFLTLSLCFLSYKWYENGCASKSWYNNLLQWYEHTHKTTVFATAT